MGKPSEPGDLFSLNFDETLSPSFAVMPPSHELLQNNLICRAE